MALSTMITDRYQKFELSLRDLSFRRSRNIYYIYDPTTDLVKKKIIVSLETLANLLPCQSFLVQFWAATEIGNKVVLLTTTYQPFGLLGNNKELQTYHEACLDHKFYVYRNAQKEVAIGLPGTVFLYCKHEQTQDLHTYHHENHRPPCDGAIFNRKWGSFAVPVVYANKCVGVLEFVMDTPNGSNYDNEIDVVYGALQRAGFHSSIQSQTNPTREYIKRRERSRKTSSSYFTKYFILAQFFGLSSGDAAAKLGEITGKEVTEGTFKNSCRSEAILEWPYESKHRTTRASSDPETQVNPTTTETTSFSSLITTDYIPSWNVEIPTTTQPPLSDQYIPCHTGSFGNPMATEPGCFGSLADSEYMTSYTSSFGNQISIEYMASERSSFGIIPPATDHMSNLSSLIPIMDTGNSEWSYTQSMTTTEESFSENEMNYEIAHAASFATATDHMSNLSSLIPNKGFGIETITSHHETVINGTTASSVDFMQDSDGMEYHVNMELFPDLDRFAREPFDFENWSSYGISYYG